MSNEGIQNCIEETLGSFYSKRIFKHPLYGKDGAPWIQLIIGIWSPVTGRVSLVSTNEHLVNTVADYECLGIGSYFARYACGNLFRRDMPLRDATVLAIHVLQQTKNNVPNCGKQSQFIAIVDGDISPTSYLDISFGEKYSDEFIQLSNILLFDLANPDKSVDDVTKSFSRYAQIIRDEQMKKTAQYEALYRALAGLGKTKQNVGSS